MRHRSIIHLALSAAIAFPSLSAIADEVTEGVEITVNSREPIELERYEHDAANITIDGRLSEIAWLAAAPHADLKVIEPDTLADPRYRTEIRFFYTERGLYVSFDMEQPADTLLRRYSARDNFSTRRDSVSMTLDSSGDGRYGYWMSLALGDNQSDGTVLPERQFSQEWDGAWYGAARESETGWIAEYFIPWSQMAMPKEEGVRHIGFYGSRSVGVLNERWGWPALPNTIPQFMSVLQPLELVGVNPRQQWSVFPYASSTIDRIDDTTTYKAGADIFWRPSSNFQLTAALNPDFGSVESDDVVVNLTANETFFPEKRLFFQEGRSIFDTTPRAGNRGGGRDRFTVINTRRIGARSPEPDFPDGVELGSDERVRLADLLGAAKTTGQLGAFRYGLLAAFEGETKFRGDDGQIYIQDGRDFGAIRVLYEDSRGAAYRGLGFISTRVAHPDSDAVVHAADFHYLSTNGQWNVDGQALYSDTVEEGDGSGAYADITYVPKQGLSHRVKLTYFDGSLDVNDFGFSRRNNIRDVQYRIEWIKSGLTRIRNLKLTPFLRYAENGEGKQVSGGYGSSAEITFNNLHFLNMFAAYFPARFDDRNSFGNGTYRINERARLSLDYKTNEANAFSLNGRFAYEAESLDGNKLDFRAGIGWRPRSNLNLQLEMTYTERDAWLLHQEDQDFTTFATKQWQPKINLDYFITARQQLRLGVQWVGIQAVEDRFYTLPTDSNNLIEGLKPPGETDSFSISQLSFQLRYRWEIAPLSDLFIVYTRAASDRPELASFGDLLNDAWNNPIGDQLVIKLRYRIGS